MILIRVLDVVQEELELQLLKVRTSLISVILYYNVKPASTFLFSFCRNAYKYFFSNLILL